MDRVVKSFLLAGVPNPIGLAVVGSQAYGLARPTSDVDRLGVYVEPTDRFLGLHPPVGKEASKVRHGELDVQWHEVGKFIGLVLGGNPTVTELLWSPDHLVEINDADTFALLRYHRTAFLSAGRVRDAYYGYAQAQFKRLVERGRFAGSDEQRREKHARHLLRLVDQGLYAYEHGVIKLAVDDPDRYFEFGRSCVRSTEPAERMLAEASARFDAITTPLPEKPDTELANELLVYFRRQYLA